MEFKKARQRAKEERDKTRPPTTVPQPVGTDVPPGSDRATGLPAAGATRGIEKALHLDPLAEFLAAYDDGDESFAEDLQVPAAEDERRFLSFDLEGERYAASIMDIREILKLVALTEVPRAPVEVLGVLSKRGLVMPVVDLASLLGLRPAEKDVKRDQRVLVVGDGERVVGLRVDRVHEVVRLAQRGIEEVPPSLGSRHAHMLLGLGRAKIGNEGAPQMLILLDVEAVLAHLAEVLGIEAKPGVSLGGSA